MARSEISPDISIFLESKALLNTSVEDGCAQGFCSRIVVNFSPGSAWRVLRELRRFQIEPVGGIGKRAGE